MFAFEKQLSDRNLTSIDYDHGGTDGNNLFKNDDHLTAFGLALMQNGFQPPSAILNSHTFQQMNKQQQITNSTSSATSLNNGMGSSSGGGTSSGGASINHPHVPGVESAEPKWTSQSHSDDLNAWNAKSNSFQTAQKSFKWVTPYANFRCLRYLYQLDYHNSIILGQRKRTRARQQQTMRIRLPLPLIKASRRRAQPQLLQQQSVTLAQAARTQPIAAICSRDTKISTRKRNHSIATCVWSNSIALIMWKSISCECIVAFRTTSHARKDRWRRNRRNQAVPLRRAAIIIIKRRHSTYQTHTRAHSTHPPLSINQTVKALVARIHSKRSSIYR